MLKQKGDDYMEHSHLTFTCSKSTIETLKMHEIYLKLTIKTQDVQH